MTLDDLRVRLKRWLIAGLDDNEWEEADKRSKHVGMGGMYMCDFAMGLTEEECDMIANGA